MQQPSLGRIVHYNDPSSGVKVVGMVIDLPEPDSSGVVPWVRLKFCNRGGTWNDASSVTYGTGSGQWEWPAKV